MKEVRPLRAYAEVVLGRQRSPQNDTGPHMVPYLRAANVKDGELDLDDVKAMNFEPSEQRVFGLRSGDVLVTEGSGSLRAVGASAVWSEEIEGLVCFQNTLLRLRPRASTDPRFLAWWCRYAFGDGLFASIATGANIYHLSADRLRSLPMAYEPLDRQRAIADFLDAETARIDALIEKKRRLVELIDEREQAALLATIGDWRRVATRTLRQYGASVVTGPFGTQLAAGEYVSGGVPLINPTHIRRGRLVPDDDVSLTPAVAVRLARHRLSTGDIVLGRKGDVGRAAVVPSHADGWICGSDSIAIRTGKHLRPGFLGSYLHLALTRQFLASVATGAMVANVNEQLLLSLPVPDLTIAAQVTAEEAARALHNQFELISSVLEEQVRLFLEHRQAIITSAVTGELEIAAAA